ncbi:hypothetical protein [Leyella stercorea]|uniref:hypothetical protein n=1 Tax=Leyella stercorea TaxID=363265 RepID=UPI00248D266C|nr:hypothetical protein [Leyella stercorea]
MCKNNLRRPTQTYAPTDADVRTDRRRCPHRPTQMSASTDADVRTDRRGWCNVNFLRLNLSLSKPWATKAAFKPN